MSMSVEERIQLTVRCALESAKQPRRRTRIDFRIRSASYWTRTHPAETTNSFAD